ncbi:MAG: M15 family metallopeptidase [Oscillospiraceae bacterium]|nr:M15 family metallopeptidase [Oscillospiraceae bacterium]MBQ7012863.1 M15 family metallopeptidase [Oscillospiraceae bacterium]
MAYPEKIAAGLLCAGIPLLLAGTVIFYLHTNRPAEQPALPAETTVCETTAAETTAAETTDTSITRTETTYTSTTTTSTETTPSVTSTAATETETTASETETTAMPEETTTQETTTAETTTETSAAAAPTYIDGILVVNKTYPLPKDYNPGMDPECEAQFALLRKGAKEDGINIYLSSGFRSYTSQSYIYHNNVKRCGKELADTFSARPGHSEHQSGLAIDVNIVSDRFIGTPEAIWLAEHAHEYGFIIRYPEDKTQITGYKYEPWHIRYLGLETAQAVYESGMCLEEYLGITSVYAE